MKKSYYLFNPGRLSRKDNTLKFVPVDENGKEQKARYLPVESVGGLYCFGSLDANSALYNFLGKQQIPVHFFDYYEHYTGSFYPKEQLQAGQLQLVQSQHFTEPDSRMQIAKAFLQGASHNMLKNLAYYNSREKDLQASIEMIETYRTDFEQVRSIPELMGLEGNIRQTYYGAFDMISDKLPMNGRSKQPPGNEMNALISFGNMICYTACLDALYHTQLNPTISFLHEPGVRRFSLALDLAEIFKPVLIDRTIFAMVNQKMLTKKDFNQHLNGCLLNEQGKKKFLKQLDEKMNTTIQHRHLKKKVSYKRLIRLECYKLTKHLMGIEAYRPFKAWW